MAVGPSTVDLRMAEALISKWSSEFDALICPPVMLGSSFHHHRNENGVLVRCYHKCKSTLGVGFWLGLTFSFPFEHALWHYVWPFKVFASFMGLD